jgi:hypothetical protein
MGMDGRFKFLVSAVSFRVAAEKFNRVATQKIIPATELRDTVTAFSLE